MTEGIRYFFVYGTLRPDDNSKAPWTQKFLKNMIYGKARIRGARLYVDSYPVVLYPDKDATASDIVTGYVVTTQDDALLAEKLRYADDVEGHPTHYQRIVWDGVEILEGSGPTTVTAWVYTRSSTDEGAKLIASGDWLQR